jgi:putative GTP pyrophosphokinase
MPTKAELKKIDELVKYFKDNEPVVRRFLNGVLVALLDDSNSLKPHIHSIRSRIKDPDHLKDKLIRKLEETKQKGKNFVITPRNLLVKINDLAGIRILHLHTWQFEKINNALLEILNEHRYRVVGGPFARAWDDEYREFFGNLRVKTQKSPSLYTSVHYVIESASRTKVSGEIQVRTLMEEVWGEVDHAINYPHPIRSIPCAEQIKVLARVTSSATRLVDSIFATHRDLQRPRGH